MAKKTKRHTYKGNSEKNIKEIKPDYYEVRVSRRINGKLEQRKRSGIKGKPAARRMRDQLRDELAVLHSEENEGNIMWTEAVREYFDRLFQMPDKYAPKTAQDRKYAINKHFSSWEKYRLKDFSRPLIQTFFDLNFDESVSAATKNKYLRTIRGIFNHQISKSEILRVNPAKGIHYKVIPKEKGRLPTHKELVKLFKHVRKESYSHYALYRVAYGLGLRSGELWALKWDDIDLKTGKITVRKSYCWSTKTEKEPKAGKSRSMIADASLIKFLKSHKKVRETGADSEYVLARLSDWRAGKAAKTLKSYQRAVDIPETNFHALRACFISTCLNKTKNPNLLIYRHIFGHSRIRTTLAHYHQVDDDSLKGMLSAVSVDID